MLNTLVTTGTSRSSRFCPAQKQFQGCRYAALAGPTAGLRCNKQVSICGAEGSIYFYEQ
jgi:hypothetical protein